MMQPCLVYLHAISLVPRARGSVYRLVEVCDGLRRSPENNPGGVSMPGQHDWRLEERQWKVEEGRRKVIGGQAVEGRGKPSRVGVLACYWNRYATGQATRARGPGEERLLAAEWRFWRQNGVCWMALVGGRMARVGGRMALVGGKMALVGVGRPDA